MHPLKRIFDRRDRAAASTVNARFVSEIGNGMCWVVLSDTNAQVRAKRAISTTISPGQDVIVARPDGSGRSKNTGYTIIGLAGATMSGASTPVDDTTSYAGVTVTRIDPDPAIITAGDVVTITILGYGFLSVPAVQLTPSYGSELLTDDEPPEINDTSIVLHVRSDASLEAGDYVLNLGVFRSEPAYFQVAAAAATPDPVFVWISTFIGEFIQVQFSDLSVLATFGPAAGGQEGPVGVAGGTAYLISGTSIVAVDLATSTQRPDTVGAWIFGAYGSATLGGGFAIVPQDAATNLYVIAEDGTITTTALDAGAWNGSYAMVANGTDLYVNSNGEAPIHKIDTVVGTIAQINATDWTSVTVARDGGRLYVYDENFNGMAAMAFDGSILDSIDEIVPDLFLGGRGNLVSNLDGDFLVTSMTGGDPSETSIWRIDFTGGVLSGTLVATIPAFITYDQGSTAGFGHWIITADSSGKIAKIDTRDFTVTTSIATANGCGPIAVS